MVLDKVDRAYWAVVVGAGGLAEAIIERLVLMKFKVVILCRRSGRGVRRAAGLEVILSSTVLAVEGNATAPPLVLTLSGGGRGAAVGPGDIVEPLSAIPSSIIVADCSFTNSRASGVILQTNAATVEGNTIANVSSNAIASGG